MLLPALAGLAVLIGGLAPQSPLRDAISGASPAGMELRLPVGYVLLSPFSRLFDTIGLLSSAQHIAIGVTSIAVTLLAVGWRPAQLPRRPRRMLATAAVSIGTLVIVYASAVALPRPMAMLAVSDPDVVRVDFHSHTRYSHDARHGFTPEANRAWHRAGGYDVAYISDHNSFTGAEEARLLNPRHGGDGTTLLSAFEGRYLGTFEIFLSLTEPDSAVLMDIHRQLHDGRLVSGRVPVSVAALPTALSDVQAKARDGPPHIAAIEIVDGSPRGYAQQDRQGSDIIGLADSLGIALVVGSNNHGWGRVAPGWTLLSIPGWRTMVPDSLAAVIESTIRTSPRAVRAVERRRPTGMGLALAFTAPVVVAQILRALSPAERLIWLVWILGVAFLWHRLRSRRVTLAIRKDAAT
ncbi:MAG TPA: hypothetical protein VII02_12330 [Gemmatimonadaceae bacterium]